MTPEAPTPPAGAVVKVGDTTCTRDSRGQWSGLPHWPYIEQVLDALAVARQHAEDYRARGIAECVEKMTAHHQDALAAERARREAAEMERANVARNYSTLERSSKRAIRDLRRALLDLADRGHGVARPKWLRAAIDAARASTEPAP